MYEQHNVDIIFVAAGASSQGVFDAVQQIKTPNKYVIGVDSNQNYIVPGKVLTSLEKKVDIEVYNSIQSVVLGKFSPGVMTYGLQDGGIDWAFDKYNKALFTKHDITTINTIKKNILENKISVPDYYKLNGGK
jgi:basic membrane protein A